MSKEENRMMRRDKVVHKAKFAPKIGGMPLGRPKGYWMTKHREKGSESRT
jgi:hypothetical protein